MNRQEKIAALASTYAALGVDVEKSIQVATDVLAVIFPPLDQIDRDEDFQRDYIPVPGGYEFQTKGKGSTYRIAAVEEDDRMPFSGSSFEHDFLTDMAIAMRNWYGC